MVKMWMVRAGEYARLFNEFKTKKIIAVGWNELGDISKITPPSELKNQVKTKYPDYKEGQVAISAGQIIRFRFDFKKEDYVITYNPETRLYLIGKIMGDYEWNTKLCEYHHVRKVEWLGDVPRDNLSITTKNTLGAISTIFELSGDAEQEILNQLTNKPIVKEETKSGIDLDTIKEDIRLKAHEFIKDQILKLSWDDMQRLVAGILRSMGYKTKISPAGSDRGKDILASKDGLGLEDPRIIVEVKHRSGQMGSKEVRSFTGGLRAGTKGIYVSTGGFTKEAKYEAERSNIPLTLIELDELVELIVQYYDNFDAETRVLIPLTKIYWPE